MKITKNQLRQIILEEVKRYVEVSMVTEVAPAGYHRTDSFQKVLQQYLDKAPEMNLPIKRTWNYNDGIYFWLDDSSRPNTSVRRESLPDWAERGTANSSLPVPPDPN